MVPSSADKNKLISQSEKSATTILSVVNIILLQRARVSGDQNATSPVF